MKEPLIFSINHIVDRRETNAERTASLLASMLYDMEEAAEKQDRDLDWATLKIEGRRPDIEEDGPAALLRGAVVFSARAQSVTE